MNDFYKSKYTGSQIDELLGKVDAKQDILSTEQLNAVNSGITAEKVSKYDDYESEIAGKQKKLTAGANITITEDGVISSSGQVGTNWGSIGGDISNQTDLQNALAKLVTLDTEQTLTAQKTWNSDNYRSFVKSNAIQVGNSTGNEKTAIVSTGVQVYDSSANVTKYGTDEITYKGKSLFMPTISTSARIATNDDINQLKSDLEDGTITVMNSEYANSATTASNVSLQTTAPTEAITDGGVHIVVLDSAPATEYNGYIYLIKE